MVSLSHLCCVIITMQVVMVDWIQGANSLNATSTRQQSTKPPDSEKIREDNFHEKERIVFTKIFPSPSPHYLEYNNSKSYKFDSTSFLSTVITTVEQIHYKTTFLADEDSKSLYHNQIPPSSPNIRGRYQDNLKTNDNSLFVAKDNVSLDETFKTVPFTNNINMQISFTSYNLTTPTLKTYQKNSQNQQQLSYNHFVSKPTKHTYEIQVLSEKNKRKQHSNSFQSNQEFIYLNYIKPTAVILDELSVVSLNYTSSKNFGSRSRSLESSSLALNITINSKVQESRPSESLSTNEENYLSSTWDEIEQKTAQERIFLNSNLKILESKTSEPKTNMNFSHVLDISSRALNVSTKEVPVLKTKILKSNSIVLTNIEVRGKRFCRLCKTVTEPLKTHNDFKVKITSDSPYFPEPKTKYSIKVENDIESKIPEYSNSSFIINSTVPPISVFEPRTKIPTIMKSVIPLPKPVSKNTILYFPSSSSMERGVSAMLPEISKTLSFQVPETISSYEMDDMEYSSNTLDSISLHSSLRLNTDIPSSHQRTAYLNLY